MKVKIKPAERLRWTHSAHWEKAENDCADSGTLERESDLVALRIQSSLIVPPPVYR